MVLGEALNQHALATQAQSAALIGARVSNPVLGLDGQRCSPDEKCRLHEIEERIVVRQRSGAHVRVARRLKQRPGLIGVAVACIALPSVHVDGHQLLKKRPRVGS
jgi:hypothetical protein